ncbi:PqqD family peptide modification chaperone [Algibacter mikhailovii]|uniref:PqqD family peptide modification chaperone n=1 Tax=Algibacter mikhailovii TaxID=425498 RepID=UPI0024951172|nr:PqqD family peptide modification chaperone [Algibacter mikhailovii]
MNLKWQINPEVLSSKIDEEAILMSFEAESYFGLDPVGSRIWELLSKKPVTADELVVHLMEEYEVNEATCREDVQRFIDDMLAKKLIQQVPVSA